METAETTTDTATPSRRKTTLLLVGVLAYMSLYSASNVVNQFFNVSAWSPVRAASVLEKLQWPSCTCTYPQEFTSQAGQDKYVLDNIFFSMNLCCKGVFVEFGARNGIEHSNTFVFEKYMGWKGLLFEVDDREYALLDGNRPNADKVLGPVCPSTQNNVTIILSKIPGWTGATDSYEPSRSGNKTMSRKETFKCYHLARELSTRNMYHVDYMTIDTEGSELDIVKDFPWNQFDIQVVQIEQLDEVSFPAQRGRKDAIIQHMTSVGYKLFVEFQVSRRDTLDLIFTKSFDQFNKTLPNTR